jgi:hypothetical protein
MKSGARQQLISDIGGQNQMKSAVSFGRIDEKGEQRRPLAVQKNAARLAWPVSIFVSREGRQAWPLRLQANS